MPSARDATPEEQRQLQEMHAAGMGRNEIMRATGWSGRFVTNNCKALGLVFVRGEQVKLATEAKKADARQLRAELALNLLLDADRMRRQLFAKHTAFNFGGKENTYAEQEIDEPTPSDKRALMGAIAAAIDKSIVIDKYDSKTGEESDFDRFLEYLSGGDET
ncbi:helix-turn-helix domain-containing protein [Catellatospora coxensis]|uniref:Uncharacterized protein n=1 Tax=Catellatospora coxensis TaxID=310354 RepID=A0A8J3PAU3_9ACTN|nr:helix-turn-helix domain-containing protein [Catellatospora coxensis]GIG10202.1 hypothetical protein Cco03nite_69020 [Catellatospora coxensis]